MQKNSKMTRYKWSRYFENVTYLMDIIISNIFEVIWINPLREVRIM